MPADTYSATLGYLVMGTGNDNNTWGGLANADVFQIFEDAIANALTNTVTGGGLDLSGSPPPAAASQTRYAALIFNGTLLSGQSVTVPNLRKFWWVQNATSGAFTLTMKTSSGSAVVIPQNSGWQLVICDGADTITVSPFNTKQIQMPDGSLSAPPYSNINETNSGWYRFGTQDWRLVINGAAVLQATGPGAATPSVFNVLSPLSVQSAGAQIVPPGLEAPYAGITAPTGWYLEYGQAVTRAGDAALFAAITTTVTGNTNANTSITGLSADMRGIGLDGALVEGTGISLGTTITFTSATTATLSLAAAGSSSGITLRILPYGQGNGSTTFNVPDRRERVLAGRGDMGGTDPGRITQANAGFNPASLAGAGGTETITVAQANLPNVTLTTTIAAGQGSHAHAGVINNSSLSVSGPGVAAPNTVSTNTSPQTLPAMTGTTPLGGSGTAIADLQPTAIANFIIKR